MPKNTRMTKQRKAILEVLKNTDSHPTADEIYEEVKKEIPNISLGTIYRNLNVLEEMDEIMVLDYGSTHSRFDGCSKNHYHFHCSECEEIYDLDMKVQDELNSSVEDNFPFEVNKHRLEFYGLCPDCQK
ncbi:Fur family transcriptional regulator [Halarsenatibacter silvermanii]|uniref:Fur family transcriptional regulator, peroxide stress response regulator n=1 Tax=Halarsenatibacter silvermanii TaxID=321763 RepID=A0A1G9JPK8_9FIRM|nr:transcriptional repressor [Halarsenatibacter silvermanii]SDL39246.1 Fur family transcriptional regulator, peroxide stress response regulator [Halarsenatibacter silvermanii]